jgi:hypothetical protein
MDETKRLIGAIIKFLGNEVQANRPTEELTESLEVAMQCLESAYQVNMADLPNDPPLNVIFKNGLSPELVSVILSFVVWKSQDHEYGIISAFILKIFPPGNK